MVCYRGDYLSRSRLENGRTWDILCCGLLRPFRNRGRRELYTIQALTPIEPPTLRESGKQKKSCSCRTVPDGELTAPRSSRKGLSDSRPVSAETI